MRRVVSVWLPHWPTDRLRRRAARSPEPPAPLVTALHDGRRRIIAAADPVAATLGLRPGMAVAQALAIVPGLEIIEAEPATDHAALERLARWCHRLTPLTAIDGTDGLWLDITGCAHLAGGEATLLRGLLARFARDGLHARAAVADTPGAAHGVARYGTPDGPAIVPPGEQGTALATLPVAALRIPPELEATLRRLGFDQVRHLSRIPRALVARRFGPLPGLRLDQAHGQVHEPLRPLLPAHVLQRRTCFLEPLLTMEALAIVIRHLVEPLCVEMERTGLGARQLDLLFERVDSHLAAVRVGTARPVRDVEHLVRLLAERLETVDPGLGVEAMRLVVPLAEPLRWEQQDGDAGLQDVSRLVDRLANRLGEDRIFRAGPQQSEVPERSTRRAPPEAGPTTPAGPDRLPAAEARQLATPAHPAPVLAVVACCPAASKAVTPQPGLASRHLHLVETAPPADTDPPFFAWKRPWMRSDGTKPANSGSWPSRLEAPARLLDPPRRIEALAALPDQPPIAFTWRRRRHRVRRADGPERVHGEWWQTDPEMQSIRDYFQVEDESGQRFWLFRAGNGLDSRTGDLSWFLHGLF